MTTCIPPFPFSSLRLAPASNNPLSVLGCLLGPLLSKHTFPGRILLEQVLRKSVTQEGDSFPMDKDTSLGWRKGKESQPCPPVPLPCSLISIKFQGPRSSQKVTEQTCSQVGLMGNPPKWHLSSRKSERPDARLLWLLSQPQASCLPWRWRVFLPPETPGGAMRLKARAGGAEL